MSDSGTTTLDRLPPGQSARVTAVSDVGHRATRLMEMGLLPGVAVRLTRLAPLGDPIDIQVRGYHLSLRAAEAKLVTVRRDEF